LAVSAPKEGPFSQFKFLFYATFFLPMPPKPGAFPSFLSMLVGSSSKANGRGHPPFLTLVSDVVSRNDLRTMFVVLNLPERRVFYVPKIGEAAGPLFHDLSFNFCSCRISARCHPFSLANDTTVRRDRKTATPFSLSQFFFLLLSAARLARLPCSFFFCSFRLPLLRRDSLPF